MKNTDFLLDNIIQTTNHKYDETEAFGEKAGCISFTNDEKFKKESMIKIGNSTFILCDINLFLFLLL